MGIYSGRPVHMNAFMGSTVGHIKPGAVLRSGRPRGTCPGQIHLLAPNSKAGKIFQAI